MMNRRLKKQERLDTVKALIEQDPFLTDEEISEKFAVSIQTVRLDRLELNIPELRERMKGVATQNYEKVRYLSKSDIMGEIIDLELNKRGISLLETDKTMAFESTRIVKGHYIFAMAESLAIAVIDAKVAITGVANIKYKVPVLLGQKLIAKAEIVRRTNEEYYVHVMINVKDQQVFRSKFIMHIISDHEQGQIGDKL
jgi:acyl-coenzyme A thioesterase PaaI-like protein